MNQSYATSYIHTPVPTTTRGMRTSIDVQAGKLAFGAAN